jgi:hypothetical protein
MTVRVFESKTELGSAAARACLYLDEDSASLLSEGLLPRGHASSPRNSTT